MSLEQRREHWNAVGQTIFDVVIVGGGSNGAAIFHRLCAEGYRVLLVEKGDFAGATSQASAMMIWGSLPDLRRLSLIKVGRLCASRERLIKEKDAWISPQKFRYLPDCESERKRLSAYAALYSYWLLGAARRSRPRCPKDFTELDFLNRGRFPFSLEYEEACVAPSDARFVLEWILHRPFPDEQIALNYCNFQNASFDRADKLWRLELADAISGRETEARAKWIVNAAGTWTDHLNRRFRIESPYKHIFGKGVFIGITRHPQHFSPLMIETRERDGCMALIPWGPIALWGPTETSVASAEEGFSAKPEDVRFLLEQLNRHLARPVSIEDIVSLRCGVRPIAVKRSFSETSHTAGVPREYRVCRDRRLPWISVYGGKLTSGILLAKSVADILRDRLAPRLAYSIFPKREKAFPELEKFPSLDEKIPSARWCAEREMCRNLEDYLRRRTNVSQWIARGGLGAQNENSAHLTDLADAFCADKSAAETALGAYKQKIEREFDAVLANVA